MNFTLRPASLPTEYPQIARLLNTALAKPVTAEELQEEDADLPPGSIKEQFIAVTEGGQAVGYAEAHRFPNTKVGKFYIYLVTDPSAKGRGVGSALLAEVERVAAANGGNYLVGDVRDDDPPSLAFMEKRGYKVHRHGWHSTLDLTAWDGAPFASVLPQVNAGGIRLVTLDQEPPDADRKLYEMMSHTMVDIPGYEAAAFMAFETFSNWVIKGAGKEHIIVAADGDRYVGVTILNKQEDGTYYTPHTSVLREYRGRQIALALKLAAIDLARAAGAVKMTTGNDSLNGPMLAVNKKLGYVPSAGSYDVAKYL